MQLKHAKLKRLGEVAVIVPRGALVGSEETDELERLVRELAAEGNRHVVVNLSETELINSWALGVLIGGFVNYSKRQGEMKLCNVADKISNLLVITKLVKVFEVYDSEEEAVASFASA